LQPEDDLGGGLAIGLGKLFVDHAGHEIAAEPEDEVVDLRSGALDLGEAGDGGEKFFDAGLGDGEAVFVQPVDA